MEINGVSLHHNTTHGGAPQPTAAFNGTGGGTHAPHKMMMMHMTFFWGKNTQVLFSGWPGSSPAMYGLALVFVFFLAVLVEWFSHCNLVNPDSNRLAAVLFRTGLYAVRTGFYYMVMLAVMSFNVGFAIFGSRVFKK
ncbi:copper transporter 1-like [Cornus florida]|uniref:copper transporter 1-like n=1 Tax=Cornus florida TaxID=4283 RepID=UPI002897EF01|nr:copper transporter 1-like [Cornus florida]